MTDFVDQKLKPNRGGWFWNLLTIVMGLGVVIVIGVTVLVFQNPQNAVNPYPPPTLPVIIALPTATETPLSLPPTWTPEVTETPSPSPTEVIPTRVPDLATPIPTDSELLFTATPTEKASSVYPFSTQSAPAAIDATVLFPERVCNWMGVGGQVVDMQARPLTGVGVQLGGSIGGKLISLTSLTGTALQYGTAGYEFTISDVPTATQGSFWIRLVDQANLPLSGRIYFDTFDACEKNLTIINFKQLR
jgi:hypothetical protein